MRDCIIHLLGGYTKKEYNRIQEKYQALLDSNTNNKSAILCNEYMWRLLRDLDNYATTYLYGLVPDVWADKLYNVIHNNWLRMTARYIYVSSTIIYRLDITLDSKDQFLNVLKESSEYDKIERLNIDCK